MSWLPILISGWLVCSVAAALLIGRMIGLRDSKAREGREPLDIDHVPLPRRAQPHEELGSPGADALPRTGQTPPR